MNNIYKFIITVIKYLNILGIIIVFSYYQISGDVLFNEILQIEEQINFHKSVDKLIQDIITLQLQLENVANIPTTIPTGIDNKCVLDVKELSNILKQNEGKKTLANAHYFAFLENQLNNLADCYSLNPKPQISPNIYPIIQQHPPIPNQHLIPNLGPDIIDYGDVPSSNLDSGKRHP